jgi:predicted DNA-binding protein (MmcQ/YjbR family)
MNIPKKSGDEPVPSLPDGVEAPVSSSEGCETLRRLCLDLPGVVETQAPGLTAFNIDQRSFVVIETHRDTTGRPYSCVALRASFFDHQRLARDPAFFPAPYLGGSGWLGRRLDDPVRPIDWSEMGSILSRSHRQIAGRKTASRAAV